MPRSSRVRPVTRRVTRLVVWSACTLVLLVPRPAAAQVDDGIEIDRDRSDSIPAHLAVIDGDIQLEREGQIEEAAENMPLLAGDRLVARRGRAEVLFADGSVVDLDHESSLDFLADDLIRLTAGRLRLTMARSGSPVTYRVDVAGATALILAPGEYRIEVSDPRAFDPDVRLTVFRGSAELTTPAGRSLVRAGYESRATARSEPSLPYFTNVSAWDDFERWVLTHRDDRLGLSAQYLPAELRYYSGTFDRDGWWRYQQDVGYVWYPRVAADWRPYYDGGWSFVGVLGWTWVGGGRWGWPTHHYGRWGFSTGSWYWIPGRRWAPAWVSWASAPGYVGWCPLGWDNRPVVSITQVNVYVNRNVRGWTVLPDRSFSGRYAAPRSYANARAVVVEANRFAPSAVPPVRPAMARDDVQPLRAPIAARSAAARTPSVEVMPESLTRRSGATARSRSTAPNSDSRSSSSAVMPPTRDDGVARARSRSRVTPPYGDRPTSRTAGPSAEAPEPAPSEPTSRFGRSRTAEPQPPAGPPPDRPQYGRRRVDPPSAEPSRPSPGPSQPSAEPSRPSGPTARSRSIPAPSSPPAGPPAPRSDGGGDAPQARRAQPRGR